MAALPALQDPVDPIGKDYVVVFGSLRDKTRFWIFPCDALGSVDMDDLSETARNNYLYARAVVGREFARPAVIETGMLEMSGRRPPH